MPRKTKAEIKAEKNKRLNIICIAIVVFLGGNVLAFDSGDIKWIMLVILVDLYLAYWGYRKWLKPLMQKEIKRKSK